jgi:hypothetical protein
MRTWMMKVLVMISAVMTKRVSGNSKTSGIINLMRVRIEAERPRKESNPTIKKRRHRQTKVVLQEAVVLERVERKLQKNLRKKRLRFYCNPKASRDLK